MYTRKACTKKLNLYATPFFHNHHCCKLINFNAFSLLMNATCDIHTLVCRVKATPNVRMCGFRFNISLARSFIVSGSHEFTHSNLLPVKFAIIFE